MGLYIVMVGVQGAGKGTQAKFIQEKFGIPQISTGDLFRAMKTQDTPLAQEVRGLMNEGKLIPDDVTNRMVEERLKESDAQEGAILDGYPRNTGQAEAFDAVLAERGEEVSAVIVLDLPRETAIKRIEGRRYSQDMSRVYNIYFDPPKNEGVDDVDEQPLKQREDDNREAVEARIGIYYETTAPIIDYYREKGVVIEINADQNIETVRDAVLSAVEGIQ